MRVDSHEMPICTDIEAFFEPMGTLPVLTKHAYGTLVEQEEFPLFCRKSNSSLDKTFHDLLLARLRRAARQAIQVEHSVLRREPSLAPAHDSEEELMAFQSAIEVYPELARLSVHLLNTTVLQRSLFIRRLARFHDNYNKTFQVDSFEFFDSDPHCGGSITLLICCDTGDKYVYKSRSLVNEKLFYQLYNSCCRHSQLLPEVFDCDDHGWMGFVAPRDAVDSTEVSTFFLNFGILQGLSILTGLSDLHGENVIACGDIPIPIDCEVMAQPLRVRRSALSRELPGHVVFNGLSTGILPSWTWRFDGGRGVDLSALGSLERQVQLSPLPELGLKELELNASNNVLRHNGQIVQGWRYVAEISAGMRKVLTSESTISMCNALLDSLPDNSRRYIARPTQHYAQLLDASLHPVYLESTESRRKFLDDTLRFGATPQLIVDSEVAACLNLDVPRFTVVANTVIVDPYYGEPYAFPEESHKCGLAFHRAKNTSSITRERVRFEERLAIGALRCAEAASEKGHLTRPSRKNPIFSDYPPTLALQRSIETLSSSYVEGSIENNWYAYCAWPTGEIEYSALSGDYYSGIGGILESAESITRYMTERESKRFIDVVCASQLGSRSEDDKLGGALVGYLAGTIPISNFLHDAGYNSLAQQVVEEALHALVNSKDSREASTCFNGVDILFGASGALLVVSRLYDLLQHKELEDVADWLLTSIESEAKSGKTGAYWPSVIAPNGLCGYAHGNAGIAFALSVAATSFDSIRGRAHELIESALVWEFSQFDHSHSNWPDLRADAKFPFSWAWCHGTPGTLAAYYALSNNGFQDIFPSMFVGRCAYETLVAGWPTIGKGMEICLCHGELGLIAIASLVGGISPHDVIVDMVSAQGRNLMDELLLIHNAAYASETGVTMPGYFVGSAGCTAAWKWIEAARRKEDLINNPLSTNVIFPELKKGIIGAP